MGVDVVIVALEEGDAPQYHPNYSAGKGAEYTSHKAKRGIASKSSNSKLPHDSTMTIP